MTSWEAGDWCHSLDHGEPCRVIDVEMLWGQANCLIFLPRRRETLKIPQNRLAPLNATKAYLLNHFSYVSAAARIADHLERESLLAPLESTVIPLPHQLLALQRAMSGDRIRYLLADEVGLGKTIEAGLIMRELKIREQVRRILIVAPTGILLQWQSELKTHFGEEFHIVFPSSLTALREPAGSDEGKNPWSMHEQSICPLDAVKPIDTRRGWSQEQVAHYNRQRFEDLVTVGWDLVIVDEAHRIGGSTEQVARFKLGDALAQASPYLLLLSATPHQGKSDAFRRLMRFLDADALPRDVPISRQAVAPFVIRTEKRRAIDADGNPLFKPRITQLVPIEWGEKHHLQRALYEAVTEYVRNGYDRAIREKRTAVGFLMILMQRLITSSTAAIRTSLERRLSVLDLPAGQLSLFPEDISEDWSSMDGQQQLDTILNARLRGLKDERKEVELLLSASRRCEATGPDVKAEALLELIQLQQREQSDPTVKILIFTEFVPTQIMLFEFLTDRGFTVVALNGTMDFEQRSKVQRDFASNAQILISTDAGGEGLNLQVCHVVVNYDLPWNPMKIEQRIGRVDRIGQQHVVRAFNFALDGTVELRVRSILEEKLALILEEFGIDKLADVLDSEEGGISFEELFAQAIITPEDAERRASNLVDEFRQRVQDARVSTDLLRSTEPLDPSTAKMISMHQMPYWTERMTLAFLDSRESDSSYVRPSTVGYDLRWPDGATVQSAVFSRHDASKPEANLISLKDHRIRSLTRNLPVVAPGQPLPSVLIPEVSEKTSGIWSLWRIAMDIVGSREQRFLALFVSEDGRILSPTARVIWDILIELPDELSQSHNPLCGAAAIDAFASSRKAAEEQGRTIFEAMVAAHRLRIARERKKGQRGFEGRRRLTERLGLPNVKALRIRTLAEEERTWSTELDAREAALPDLAPLLMLQVASKWSV